MGHSAVGPVGHTGPVTADPLADLARAEGLPSAHAAALDAIDSVLRDRGLRRIAEEDVAAAAWTAARAAVQLEPAAELDAGASDDGTSGDGPSDADRAAATVRMLAEVPALAEQVRSTPAQALARLHTVWGRGIVPDEDLGRVRSDPQVSARLGELTRLLTTTTAAPALALAGVVHAELWSMAPFTAGSGVVALGAQQAVLVATGVDPRGVIPLAAGHLEVGGHAVSLRHYGSGTAKGVRAWLLHHAAAVTQAVELSPLAR